MFRISRIAGSGILILSLGACAGYNPQYDPYFNTKAGAVIGAVAGGALGDKIDDDRGVYIGAATGAVAGGMLGRYLDLQKQQSVAYPNGQSPPYRSQAPAWPVMTPYPNY